MKGKRSGGSASTQSETGGFKGRAWTPEEDARLRQALEAIAPGTYHRWALVSQRVQVPTKACRSRATFLRIRNLPTQQSGQGNDSVRANRPTPVQDYSGLFSDDEDSEYDEFNERMQNRGFTVSELRELLAEGVKPWDSYAWNTLRALNDGYAGKRVWTPEEDVRLCQALEAIAPDTYQRWELVSQRVQVPAKACRSRARFLRNRYLPTQQSGIGNDVVRANRRAPVQGYSYSLSSDDEDSEYDELNERMENMDFTVSEFHELLSCAGDFLRVLNDGHSDKRVWTPEEDSRLRRALEDIAPGTYNRWALVSQRVQVPTSECRSRAIFLGIRNLPTQQSGQGNDDVRATRPTPVEDYSGFSSSDEEDSEYDERNERMENLGFTIAECEELLAQGVKPWDSDAWDVLRVLNDGHY